MNVRRPGRLLVRMAAELLLRSGSTTRHMAIHREQIPIVMYHRVTDQIRSAMAVPVRRFCEHMAYLHAHFRVVTLPAVVDTLSAGTRPAVNIVAVTFDDGYRDNLTEAAPIMCSLGVSATVFVATAPQECGEPLWWDALDLGGRGGVAVRSQLKRASHADLRAAVRQSLGKLPPGVVANALEQLYLSWADLRALRDLGIDVGAHTVTHPVLSRLAPKEASSEIRRSKAALERETGREVSAFAYPNGKVGDFTERTIRDLTRLGFTSACTGVERLNDHSSNRLALGRVIARDEPVSLFALRLSGIISDLEDMPRATAAARLTWRTLGLLRGTYD
ncbi:MAG: polysaccharide deacetylase family protein [Chloroflexi bacterium]|nr:polysaccharide deacetylase family protein [Chloroflexota bacterium]